MGRAHSETNRWQLEEKGSTMATTHWTTRFFDRPNADSRIWLRTSITEGFGEARAESFQSRARRGGATQRGAGPRPPVAWSPFSGKKSDAT
jgi:hypothetical protein